MVPAAARASTPAAALAPAPALAPVSVSVPAPVPGPKPAAKRARDKSAEPAVVVAAVTAAAPASVEQKPSAPPRAPRTSPPPELSQLLRGGLRSRSLVLLGLSEAVAYKKLWVRVRKTRGVEDMAFPVAVPGSEKPIAAIVRYDTREARDKALAHFDSREVCGARVFARAGDLALIGPIAFASSRLIVRNLAFDATLEHLRAAIERAAKPTIAEKVPAAAAAPPETKGETAAKNDRQTKLPPPASASADESAPAAVDDDSAAVPTLAGFAAAATDISLPKKTAPAAGAPASADQPGEAASTSASGHRGFAFIEFLTRADAAAALAALNGKRVHKRVVAVDWALSKDEYVRAKVGAIAPPVAADSAAPTDAPATAPSSKAAAPANDDSSVESDAEDSASPDSAVDEDDAVQVAEADADSDAASPTGAAPAAAPLRAQSANDAALGTTLFLRNVAFDTRDGDLVETFRAYGPVRYARIVVDRSTGRSRGTAFVQFFTKAGADAALDAAFSKDEHWEEIPATAPARIREAIEAAKLSSGVHVGARKLQVSRAVTKADADALAAARDARDGTGASKKFDARHTYLSYEGNIRAGSDAANDMPETDLAKRSEAILTKKEKLKSPLFFVNPLRLLVRNLGKGEDDKSLAALGRRAAAAGVQSALVDVREGDTRLMPPIGATDPPIRVVRAKIVREATSGPNADAKGGRARAPRFEADGVTPRSKGFAFVEFSTHFHALAALRELNNNPAYSDAAAGGAAAKAAKKASSQWPRLIVEFAVENIVKVRAHEAKKTTARERSKTLATATAARPDADAPAEKKGRKPRDNKRQRTDDGGAQTQAAADATRGAFAKARAGPSATVGAAKVGRDPSAAAQKSKAAATAPLPAKGPRKVAFAPAAAEPERVAGSRRTRPVGVSEDDALDELAQSGGGKRLRRGEDAPTSTRRTSKKAAHNAEEARERLIEEYRRSLYPSAK